MKNIDLNDCYAGNKSWFVTFVIQKVLNYFREQVKTLWSFTVKPRIERSTMSIVWLLSQFIWKAGRTRSYRLLLWWSQTLLQTLNVFIFYRC